MMKPTSEGKIGKTCPAWWEGQVKEVSDFNRELGRKEGSCARVVEGAGSQSWARKLCVSVWMRAEKQK